MYHHLLVPVDGSDLSIQIIGQAVEFARTLGARITFFHAVPDHGASLRSESEVVWATASSDDDYPFEGRAGEILSKAESAARAHEVSCSSIRVTSDRPYEAILGAARNTGCDLIYMGSHGRRSSLGMMLGSQTLKVLMQTEIPVLVAATRNPDASTRAIGVIRDEHRSLAAVLHAWMHLIEASRADSKRLDPVLMRAIVRYIKDFPLTLHHPKEDDYLFRRLRIRTSSVDAELDELQRQHERDHQLVAELAEMVDRDPVDLDALEQAVSRYSRFIWDHMGREEGVILPAAQKFLAAEDWAEIDRAFASNSDPRFAGDTDMQYRRLFARIISLTSASAA